MALFNFTGCSGNEIGPIIVSASTEFSSGWTGNTLITLNTAFVSGSIPSVSGMCYTWDGTTASTGNVDFTVTSADQYVDENCDRCSTDYSIRVSGCTGQGTWIISSDLTNDGSYDPLGLVYTEGLGVSITSTTLNGCFQVLSNGYSENNVVLGVGDSLSVGYTNGCEECRENTCEYQDVVILIDQSGSIGSQSNFNFLTDGVCRIADELKTRMDSGEVRLSAYKWDDCNNVDLLSDLTDDYNSFVNNVSGATWDAGGTDAARPILLAYETLSANTRDYAEQNIILITDGNITDFDTPPTTIDCLGVERPNFSTTEICNQLKAGLYGNGEVIKIFTVGVVSGNYNQLNTLSSGEEFTFSASTLSDFESVTAPLLAGATCVKTPDQGEITTYTATDCCGTNQTINIGLTSSYTPTLNTDGFIYFGDCYKITEESGDNNIEYLLLSGDVINNICSNAGCPTCPTPTPTPTISLTPSITPTISLTPSITPSITQTNVDLCKDVTSESKVILQSPTPTPSITPTITPSPSVPFLILSSFTYNLDYGCVSCGNVLELINCSNNDIIYYIQTPLTYEGRVLSFDSVVNVNIDGVDRCVKVGNEVVGSVTNTVLVVNKDYPSCDSCNPTPTPTQSLTPTPSITPTKAVVCNSSDSSWLSGWIKEGYDGTPQAQYFQTRLIQVLPPDLPDPTNPNAPINYDQIRISRYDQGGTDFDSTFTSLVGSNSGSITLEYVDGSLISYSIDLISYNSSYLTVDLGGLIVTEIQSYVSPATYGICINASSVTPTPTQTPTPSITPTQTHTPTPTVTPTTDTNLILQENGSLLQQENNDGISYINE